MINIKKNTKYGEFKLMMQIVYDKVADAIYIKFSNEDIHDSEEISEGIIIDYNKESNIVGVEILNFSKRDIDLNKIIMLSEDEIVHEVSTCK